MKTKIAGYFKTSHFLLKQWDRDVIDSILTKVLNEINLKRGNHILIFCRKLIFKHANYKREELIVVLNDRALITCYYCSFQKFLDTHKKEKQRQITLVKMYEKIT